MEYYTFSQLQTKTIAQLHTIAQRLGIKDPSRFKRYQLEVEIITRQNKK